MIRSEGPPITAMPQAPIGPALGPEPQFKHQQSGRVVLCRAEDVMPGDVILQVGKAPLTVIEVHDARHPLAEAFVSIRVIGPSGVVFHLTKHRDERVRIR